MEVLHLGDEKPGGSRRGRGRCGFDDRDVGHPADAFQDEAGQSGCRGPGRFRGPRRRAEVVSRPRPVENLRMVSPMRESLDELPEPGGREYARSSTRAPQQARPRPRLATASPRARSAGRTSPSAPGDPLRKPVSSKEFRSTATSPLSNVKALSAVPLRTEGSRTSPPARSGQGPVENGFSASSPANGCRSDPRDVMLLLQCTRQPDDAEGDVDEALQEPEAVGDEQRPS